MSRYSWEVHRRLTPAKRLREELRQAEGLVGSPRAEVFSISEGVRRLSKSKKADVPTE